VYTAWAGEWKQFGDARKRRPFESVVLDKGVAENILQDVQQFIGNGKFYFDRGKNGYIYYSLSFLSLPLFPFSLQLVL